MDTHKKIREHISALKDGELPDSDLELAMAALQTADGQQAWDTYHRIGDELRAQATPELSDGFAARLAARLAAEPPPGRRIARAVGGAPDKRGAPRAGGPSGPLSEPERAAEAVAVAKAKPAIVSVS